MKTSSPILRQFAWALALGTFFVYRAAEACPGCQQAGTEGGKVALSGISLGFGFGVLFMLGTLAAVLTVLFRLMYRSCRAIAAQQQAVLDAEERDLPGGAFPSGHPA